MRKTLRMYPFFILAMLIMLCGFASAEQVTEGLNVDEEYAALQEEMEMILANVEETASIEAEDEAITDELVINILLIGTDERRSEFSDNARGDTCMLCSVDVETGSVKLISFERAIGVEVLDGEYEGEWDWLTHTFRYGGADLMVREISEHFKVDVTKYVRVNLHTFVKLVDAVGGIDIELTNAEADYINGPDGHENARDVGSIDELQTVKPGMNHLNGATALVYARCRKIDSDWGRVVRQRNVIVAAMAQLMKSDVDGMASALLSMMPLVQTNITLGEAISLTMLAPKLLSSSVEQISIPAQDTFGSMRGMGDRSMYSVDFQANSSIIREFLYQE